MALHIDSITRTSSVDPFADPTVFDIAYSGAVGAAQCRVGATVLATGPSGSGTFTGISLPVGTYTTWQDYVPNVDPFNGQFTDFNVYDGTTTDSVLIEYWTFAPSLASIYTPPATYAFTGGYIDWFVLNGGIDVSEPYDHWFTIGVVGSQSLTRDASQDKFFIGVPFVSVSWDFGDGHTSTSPTPTHAYTSGGLKTVTMVAEYSPWTVPILQVPGTSGLGGTTVTTSVGITVPSMNGWLVGRVGVGI